MSHDGIQDDQNLHGDPRSRSAFSSSPGFVLQVSQWDVAADIVDDYDAGLEYCEAQFILKSVQRGDEREYLVRCVTL